jgi:hypothetical protein
MIYETSDGGAVERGGIFFSQINTASLAKSRRINSNMDRKKRGVGGGSRAM